jgi:putative endonuclease
MKVPTVYILLCATGHYYVGSTTDLGQRVEQHQSGMASSYTSRRMPVELVFWMEFPTILEAARAEKQIKDWSHSKKDALISGDLSRLKELAACRNLSNYKFYYARERASKDK